MPFGFTNAPSTFQNYINNTLQDYLDNVLIYSDSQKENRQQVNLYLKKLQIAGLQLDIDKCVFETTQVNYLALTISRRDIEIDPIKIEFIKA